MSAESHLAIPEGKDVGGPAVLGLALTWSCSSAPGPIDCGEGPPVVARTSTFVAVAWA